MALEYYDDAIVAKLKKWIPSNANLRVLKPDETKRLFETVADDQKDKKIQLPLIALSRNNDIELLINYKTPKSFDGLPLVNDGEKTALLNAIPIKLQYQMDIYTKTYEESSEYLRQYLFKIINNPTIKIVIPYHEMNMEQIAYIRVLNTISDTSDISEHLFAGQFTRWTIQFEIQDAHLYDIPYKRNWKIYVDDDELVDPQLYSVFEVANTLEDKDVVERDLINLNFRKAPNE